MTDRYHVQVYVREGGNTYAWRRVRPSGGDPYVFTKRQAEDYIKVMTGALSCWKPEAYRLEPLDEEGEAA